MKICVFHAFFSCLLGFLTWPEKIGKVVFAEGLKEMYRRMSCNVNFSTFIYED